MGPRGAPSPGGGPLFLPLLCPAPPLKGTLAGAGAAEPGVRPLPPPRRPEWLQPGPRPPARPLLPWSGASREFSRAGGADASGADHLRVSERGGPRLLGCGSPLPTGDLRSTPLPSPVLTELWLPWPHAVGHGARRMSSLPQRLVASLRPTARKRETGLLGVFPAPSFLSAAGGWELRGGKRDHGPEGVKPALPRTPLPAGAKDCPGEGCFP